jgi:hypothetical protein
VSEIVPSRHERRIPLVLKVALTVFVAVLVVCYWRAWGPSNFLYFCDVALFLTLLSVLTEKSLPVSMAAVGIFILQFLWILDFIGGLFGHPFLGASSYMFDSEESLYARGLSLFHGWLPLLIVYILYRLGYDRRALLSWTVLAWVLLLISYFLLPPPPETWPGQPVNVNFAYGPSNKHPQTWMPPLAWLGLLMVVYPLVFFAPTHFALAWLMKPAGSPPGPRRPRRKPSPRPPEIVGSPR